MVKPSTSYLCETCGASQPKWSGQCLACGDWNSLVQKQISPQTPKGLGSKKGIKIDFLGLQGKEKQPPRRSSNNVEFDRVQLCIQSFRNHDLSSHHHLPSSTHVRRNRIVAACDWNWQSTIMRNAQSSVQQRGALRVSAIEQRRRTYIYCHFNHG